MRQVVYISTAAQGFDPSELGPILYSARHHNRQNEVTGLLLFDGLRFLQSLEGASREVDETLERVRKDKRHRALVILSDLTVNSREFGNWDMATKLSGATDYSSSVEDLVASVSCPNLRATFIGFAQFERLKSQ